MRLVDPSFESMFGRPPTVVVDAPGRVNLLGEHTDYCGGYVLLAAIERQTTVSLRKRDDGLVDAFSLSLDARARFAIETDVRSSTWVDYVQGVTRALAVHGHCVGGFEALIASDLPLGGGLSSSAALGVALLRGLRQLYELALDDVEIAHLVHWSENHHVGVPVGPLDPFACSLAACGRALFVDTRTLAFEVIDIPPSVELAIVDSGIAQPHASGSYRLRRSECEQAAALLGVPQLRDLPASDRTRLDALPAPLARRARHVVSENARVLEGVAALRDGAADRFGELFLASHASMRDDFEISSPEIDALVGRAAADPGVLGARLTGGGFGGAVVLLCRRDQTRAVATRLVRAPAQLVVPES